MTRAQWLGLSAVLVMSTSVAADPPCKPSAQITGESTVIRAIEVALRGRGIDVETPAPDGPAFVSVTCRRVSAEVTIGDGGRLFVAVIDADGRQTQRVAEYTEAAATVIESWARGDLLDPLLASRGTIAIGATAATVGVERARARPRFLIAAGGDVGVSGDGALWTGVRAHACGAIGTFCIGGTVRYALDSERSGDSKELASARTALGVTLTGERPMRWGRLSVSPGAGLGLTSVTATLATEPELEQASAVHMRVGLAAAYEFTHAWSVRVDLDGEVAPFARSLLGDADGIDRQLAASPKLQSWLGLALTYGGP
ncbi:MAG: hypothetical protein WKG01_01080 [Kofleriaceae bacterium]